MLWLVDSSLCDLALIISSSLQLELLSWTDLVDFSHSSSKGSFPPLGCWWEARDGSEKDPACLLLSLLLGPDSKALEDSQITYRLAKGTILPADRERFTKMQEEATLYSSLLVRQAYEVFSPHLDVLDPHFFRWFNYYLNSYVMLFFLLCVRYD